MKAITEIVVVTILLSAGIVLTALAYIFMTGFQEQAIGETQQTGIQLFKKIGSCLQIVSFDCEKNNLWLKNCGRYPIESVTVFIDEKPSVTSDINANPNEIKNVSTPVPSGVHEIKIISDYATAIASIDTKTCTITQLGFSDISFYIKSNAGENIALFSSSGNISLRGTCSAGAVCSPPANAPFIVQNLAGSAVSYIDDFGNLCIQDANCNDKDADCNNPGDGSFIIQNGSGVNVAYINSTGNLCLIGTLAQNSVP